MKANRRTFLGLSTTLIAGTALSSIIPKVSEAKSPNLVKISDDRFDPWIEIIPEALKFNVKVLHKLSGKRPIMAVVKNNGYGLGAENVASIIEDMPEIAGFAAVKTSACISIRESGISKPILHMGLTSEQDFHDLAKHDIQLSIYTENILKTLEPISRALGQKLKTHLYIDTGMSRMGIPFHKAMPWIENIASSDKIEIMSSFMGLTEEPDFDKEQVRRLVELDTRAKTKGINMGLLHAASSNAIFHYPDAAMDMVRPGISIYGAYPSYPEIESKIAKLEVAFRFRARLVRVEKLRAGDSVSYGRKYIADKPTWIATIPIGHSDGYTRNAVKGAKVLVGDKVYPVIGAVSASHTIIEVGEKESVKIGDIATLLGPDHKEIHPNHISTVSGSSVYDLLMHMNPGLPKKIVSK